MGLCGYGTQVVWDAPFRDIVGGSGAEVLRFVGAPEEDQAAAAAAAAAATGFVAGGIAAAGLQPESAHYARCRLGRTRRSYECVRSIIRAFRADGAGLSDEDFTTVHTDRRRPEKNTNNRTVRVLVRRGGGAAPGPLRLRVHDAQLRAPSGQVLAAALVDRRDNPIRRGPQGVREVVDRGGFPGLREDPHGGAAEAESSRAGKRNPLCCVCRTWWWHHGGHGRATALGQGEEWVALRAAAPERHPAQVSAPTGG